MNIELELKRIVKAALREIFDRRGISTSDIFEPQIERPKIRAHGDYATNAALVAASICRMRPRELAGLLKESIEGKEGIIEKVEVAGPGFVNFFIRKESSLQILRDIFKAGANYGCLDFGKGLRVIVEFVSANPTGPLHIGHGRNAVFGDALASVLQVAGFSVSREYYLNDSGNQMKTLGKSVYLRIKELEGEVLEFPEDCYQGHYIVDIAREIIGSKDYKKLLKMDEQSAIDWCGDYAGRKILEGIRDDLDACGIGFDSYFSERSLHEKGEVTKAIEKLEKNGFVYEDKGALWFKGTALGDEKDRVLRKSTGEYTYFASDIAYHADKFERGFDRLVDIWGADHAGHVVRMKAAMKALGYDPSSLDLVLIQFVNLIRAGETISMSTRKATFETLRQLIDEVGRDVCRYFFLMRSHNAQLDFDLELAKDQSPENPVYYIQYAHARISSIFRRAVAEGIKFSPKKANLALLDLEEEEKIARFLGEYPRVIEEAAKNLEPHKISFYLLELARIFQAYYTKAKLDERYKVVSGDEKRIQTKLYLLKNIQIVLKNGLSVLGISAPEQMDSREEL